MTQPFIDCAIALARSGVQAQDIVDVVCNVGEGTVHRLWEPLDLKQKPPTSYAAKFSTPFCMAVGFLDGRAGFAQFTEARVQDAAVIALASKIRYAIDPNDEYPRNFSGHLRARLADGSERECRQPHMRGGARAPLTPEEIEAKFMDNVRYGEWSDERATRFLATSRDLFTAPSMNALQEFRA
jgi:2-methylcitrate dehydratase PrpD